MDQSAEREESPEGEFTSDETRISTSEDQIGRKPDGTVTSANIPEPHAQTDELETIKDNLEPHCFSYHLIMRIIRAVVNKG